MSQMLIELDMPRDWNEFQLPPALNTRLQSLLDKQDHEGKLPRAERKEAEAITQLVEMLSLLKLRVRKTERCGK
jgi:hypothetical protein